MLLHERKMEALLARFGVIADRGRGQAVRPNFHEALAQGPSDEYPEGIVIEICSAATSWVTRWCGRRGSGSPAGRPEQAATDRDRRIRKHETIYSGGNMARSIGIDLAPPTRSAVMEGSEPHRHPDGRRWAALPVRSGGEPQDGGAHGGAMWPAGRRSPTPRTRSFSVKRLMGAQVR